MDLDATTIDLAIWLLGILGAAAVTVLINDPFKFLIARTFGGYDPRDQTLRGIWKGTYDYPAEGARKVEEHYFRIKQVGSYVVARTLSQGPAFYRLRGKLDNRRFLTGTWEERTPDGRFYHGAFQLAVRPHGRQMRGQWVGFNQHDVVMSGTWDWKQEAREVTEDALRKYREQSGWPSYDQTAGEIPVQTQSPS